MEHPLVGIVVHPTKNVSESVATLQRWDASGRGHLVGRRRDAARLGPGLDLLEDGAFRDQVDAVVALGGDGTMLGAMRLVAGRPVPVLGVNYGNVGFLVEIEPNELDTALDRLSAGDYSLEPHHALEATLTWSGSRTAYLAFNDLTIVRRPGAGQVSADLTISGMTYGYYRADAVVASTPAGSTAYNHAAGGPVLSPALSGSVVTPVAPMAGIDRSVVLAAKERFRLDIAEGTRSAALEVDGLVVGEVAAGAQLDMHLRKNAGSVIRLDAERHGRTGRMKLSLLDLPMRPDQLQELIPAEVRQRLRRQGRPDLAPRPTGAEEEGAGPREAAGGHDAAGPRDASEQHDAAGVHDTAGPRDPEQHGAVELHAAAAADSATDADVSADGPGPA